MRLFLVRHGQTDWNVMERAQGGADRPLDDTGVRQTAALAEAFREVAVGRVVTSDLARSRDTARAIAEATGSELVVEPLLRERHFGEMEGMFYSELREFFNRESAGDDERRNHIRPPGGESFADLWARLERAMPLIRSGPDSQVLVSHGGTSSLLCAMLLGEGLEATNKYRFHNASVTEIDTDERGGRLVRYDETIHLEGLPLLVRRGDVAAR